MYHIDWFDWLIHSFIHSFTLSLIHPLFHSFIHSFHSITTHCMSFSFILCSFISFILSFFHRFIYCISFILFHFISFILFHSFHSFLFINFISCHVISCHFILFHFNFSFISFHFIYWLIHWFIDSLNDWFIDLSFLFICIHCNDMLMHIDKNYISECKVQKPCWKQKLFELLAWFRPAVAKIPVQGAWSNCRLSGWIEREPAIAIKSIGQLWRH
jgi:hypothetical protein